MQTILYGTKLRRIIIPDAERSGVSRRAGIFVAPLCLMLACLLSPAALAKGLKFEAWTSDDGLPQNSVYSILQTRRGYLWFTTLGGLVRYDGVRFIVLLAGHQRQPIHDHPRGRPGRPLGRDGGRRPDAIRRREFYHLHEGRRAAGCRDSRHPRRR